MGGFALAQPNTKYNIDVTPGTGNNDKATYQQANTLASAGPSMMQQGEGVLGQGTAYMQQPLSYFSKLLSGSSSDIAQAMAPQVNQLQAGYHQALQSNAELDPRGGGRAAINANMPYQEAGQIGQMFQQARSGAAQSMGPLAAQMAGVGLQQEAQGTGNLVDALNAEYTRRGQNEQETASNKGLAGQLGSGLLSGMLSGSGG